jgi:hypothetical protein
MSSLLQHVIKLLLPLKQQGDTPLEAAKIVFQDPETLSIMALGLNLPSAPPPRVLPYSVLSEALFDVYQQDLNPTQLAKILHQLYPDLSATEVAQTILAPTVFPNTNSTDMAAALSAAGFSDNDVQDAIGIVYPSNVTVQANLSWQSTGVTLTGRLTTIITCTGGLWTANPWTGMCGASGNPAYVAKPGYTLPGANEGALIGRVGSNPPFLVGNGTNFPAGQSGVLSLCINDDLNNQYGVGLTDNGGSLNVHINSF